MEVYLKIFPKKKSDLVVYLLNRYTSKDAISIYLTAFMIEKYGLDFRRGLSWNC